jgi:hypothetical protein
MPAKSRKSTKKSSVEGGSDFLTLQQRTGGAMSVGSENVMAQPEFPQPFNVSSGGAKPKRVKKVVDPSKPKRKLSAYNIFVRDHMKDFKQLPAKERMSAVAKLYKESKK